MADIKTRDVTRGSIKILDRAASSMHNYYMRGMFGLIAKQALIYTTQ